MDTITFNASEMSEENFDKSIKICQTYAAKYAANPVKSQKYKDTQKRLEESKKKLIETKEKTKKIMVTVKEDGKDVTKSFYDAYIAGKEKTVTINWIGAQLKLHENEIDGKDKNLDTTMEDVFHEKYDFVDATKQVATDFVEGKGSSNGIAKKCIMVGVAELLTKGISSFLVGKGKLSESFGLIGLAKTLVTNFPNYMASLGGGMQAVWGFSPVVAITGGVLLASKVIPRLKNMFDKTTDNIKARYAGETELNKVATESYSAN